MNIFETEFAAYISAFVDGKYRLSTGWYSITPGLHKYRQTSTDSYGLYSAVRKSL